jgi:transcriptional regulator with XRE-family HTH domain
MLNRKEFGAAIRKARLENKLTQEKLAEMLGVSPVHVKQLEAGSRMPSLEVLHDIAITLNFSVDQVFFPVKTENVELLDKLERLLRLCTPQDLYVVYATASALKDRNIVN